MKQKSLAVFLTAIDQKQFQLSIAWLPLHIFSFTTAIAYPLMSPSAPFPILHSSISKPPCWERSTPSLPNLSIIIRSSWSNIFSSLRLFSCFCTLISSHSLSFPTVIPDTPINMRNASESGFLRYRNRMIHALSQLHYVWPVAFLCLSAHVRCPSPHLALASNQRTFYYQELAIVPVVHPRTILHSDWMFIVMMKQVLLWFWVRRSRFIRVFFWQSLQAIVYIYCIHALFSSYYYNMISMSLYMTDRPTI